MFNNKNNIYFTLRFASAMCFIGHGAFGIIGKKIWLNYFAVFGIGPITGTHLMPVIGTMDILAGISLLLYPTRAVAGWLVIWGTATALCRPLSGEPFAEFIERAGNYGAPLALLILCNASLVNPATWFKKLEPSTITDESSRQSLVFCLRVVVFLLLAGHGWLNLVEKQGIMNQYSSLGFTRPDQTGLLVGIAEISFAILVLIKPIRSLLLILFLWKIGSELFYPHWELFEWIERGGSYGAILALWFALPNLILNKSIKTESLEYTI